jgi:hypothetical protein
VLVERREKLSVDRLVGVWLVSTPTRVENWPAPTCSYRLVISVVIKWATPRVPAGWIPVKIDSKHYCGRLTLSPEGSLWYGHHPLPLDIEDWRTVGTGDQLRTRGLLGCFDAAEQLTDFGLPVAAMPTQGADARQLACLGPPGDGLGVNPEQRGHLCRGEQGLRYRPELNIAFDRHGFQPLTGSLSLGTIGI